MIRLTKIFTFETGHALHGYDGKCRNIHGHSYKLYVTIKGTPIDNPENSKNGMVMDFGDLKKIVNEKIVDPLDHAVLLNINTAHKALGESLRESGHQVIFTPYQPTCENMLIDFAQIIQEALPDHIALASLRLYETENSYGEWIATDQ
ncbi:6-carboxytetrahydropterin synthase QueD [Flavobacteriaceae bacterium Ap0902]|nr:6-carboxytetrahydropterin synthase QueD [Flavobacteriaceae bacterium Ap0902]